MLSVLFLTEYEHTQIDKRVFSDLNLDLLFPDKTIEILRLPCRSEDIAARQEMFRALENESFRKNAEQLRDALISFSQQKDAAEKAKSECEKLFRFRLLAEGYLALLGCLADTKGLPRCTFRDRLSDYAAKKAESAEKLRKISEEYARITAEISRFKVRIDSKITQVLRPDDADFSVNEKITHDASALGFSLSPTHYRFEKQRLTEGFSDVLMRTFPNEFEKLSEQMKKAAVWIDFSVLRLTEELNFYFSVFDLVSKAAAHNIPHSYPRIAPFAKYAVKAAYDITLLSRNADILVPNDIDFGAADRIYFLTGANGGGKTTYLRTCAVNLILFLSGCPIFCKEDFRGENEIYPFRAVFTHFPSDEGYESVGRLEEETERVRQITQRMTKDTFAFFNESFGGANETRGERLTLETATKIQNIGAFALFVTHFNKHTYDGFPMLNAIIDRTQDNRRTFRIQKSTAAENAYAADILKKYGLDSHSLEQKYAAESNRSAERSTDTC